MILHKTTSFFKKNFIFVIVLCLAIISCFIVPIDKEYINYFDWGTVACIFLILLVVAGLTNIDFFQKVARIIVKKFKNARSIIMCLIFITYISALINANDMALLTFLPLAYIVLKYTNNLKYCAFTFIMQNIASNLGGMITPIGNPQNLYIYSYYNMNVLEFFKIMALPTLFALILIVVTCLFIKKEPLEFKDDANNKLNIKKLIIYILMFISIILVVLRVLEWYWVLPLICLVMIFVDVKSFLKVDYTIPLIFVMFFIFSGNVARIPAVINLLTKIVNKWTYVTAYISCQFISNVPTAILLSKFTGNYAALLVSVNVASLGIIFSSLSGVIALKEYGKVVTKENLSKKRGVWYYIGMDTLFNVVGLIILAPLSYLTLLI